VVAYHMRGSEPERIDHIENGLFQDSVCLSLRKGD
jgi:hypothetical protein